MARSRLWVPRCIHLGVTWCDGSSSIHLHVLRDTPSMQIPFEHGSALWDVTWRQAPNLGMSGLFQGGMSRSFSFFRVTVDWTRHVRFSLVVHSLFTPQVVMDHWTHRRRFCREIAVSTHTPCERESLGGHVPRSRIGRWSVLVNGFGTVGG